MPVVKIDLWSGRSEEQKEKIIKKVTDAIVESVECPKEAVTAVIDEILKENWGSAGEQHSKKFKNIP
ncbi:MAG: 2-hydroxymuconate tautomerase [Nanoarchaeota archaeon]|nr:2-hydroxymuconate tautomerase [Nanoarchaeota archaeon]